MEGEATPAQVWAGSGLIGASHIGKTGLTLRLLTCGRPQLRKLALSFCFLSSRSVWPPYFFFFSI